MPRYNEIEHSIIKKYRKQRNMTQQELANKLCVTDRAVSHWENGRRLPDISLLKLLSEVFEVSITEILDGHKMSIKKLENQKKYKKYPYNA